MRKRCHKCNRDKDAAEFSKHRDRQDGLQPYCKTCSLTAQKWWYASLSNERYRQITVKGNHRVRLRRQQTRRELVDTAKSAIRWFDSRKWSTLAISRASGVCEARIAAIRTCGPDQRITRPLVDKLVEAQRIAINREFDERNRHANGLGESEGHSQRGSTAKASG